MKCSKYVFVWSFAICNLQGAGLSTLANLSGCQALLIFPSTVLHVSTRTSSTFCPHQIGSIWSPPPGPAKICWNWTDSWAASHSSLSHSLLTPRPQPGGDWRVLRATCTVVPLVVVLLFCTQRSCCVHTCVVHVHCSVLLCYCCALLSNSLCYCCAVHASPVLCTTSVACTSLVHTTIAATALQFAALCIVHASPKLCTDCNVHIPSVAEVKWCTSDVMSCKPTCTVPASPFCTQNSCVLSTSSLVRMLGFMSSVVHLFDLTTPIVEDPWGVVYTWSVVCTANAVNRHHCKNEVSH